ncbi:MAG TPA: hypothetical protein VFT64_02930 [Rickettsiales bacterium]|nr:hypothetical protein [Rickettsiales bacterium]
MTDRTPTKNTHNTSQVSVKSLCIMNGKVSWGAVLALFEVEPRSAS